MIGLLKKANAHLMYALVGIAVTFSVLKDLLTFSAAIAYTMGMSYTTYAVLFVLLSALLFALIARLLVRVSFRICGAIFTRNSGMLYPFPIGFREYESTALAFAFPCFFVAGLFVLPALFLPTLSNVLGALRTVVNWTFLALGAAYIVKRFGHDYDRKSLAISLSVIPLALLVFSLVLTIAEVVR